MSIVHTGDEAKHIVSAVEKSAIRTRRRRLKAFDPIFKPRDNTYNGKEQLYIRSLAPLEAVPLCLVPTASSPRPPKLYRAWLLTDAAKAVLMQNAHERQRIYYRHKAVFPDDYDWENPPANLNISQRNGINEMLTYDVAASAIAKEMGLRFPLMQLVSPVNTPDARFVDALTLYSNYTLDERPSDEDINKIGARLGLTGRPGWYPSASYFQWNWKV